MLKPLANHVVLTFLTVFVAAQAGCATVAVADADLKAITADVKICVSQDAPDAIKLVERNAGPALYEAFMCDASDGFNPNVIPACLEEAFSTETAGLGQDAERFKTCVIDKVEGDPNIKPLAKQRAHLMKVQRAARK